MRKFPCGLFQIFPPHFGVVAAMCFPGFFVFDKVVVAYGSEDFLDAEVRRACGAVLREMKLVPFTLLLFLELPITKYNKGVGTF